MNGIRVGSRAVWGCWSGGKVCQIDSIEGGKAVLAFYAVGIKRYYATVQVEQVFTVEQVREVERRRYLGLSF